jgi:RimJ/RimL family protein N-acetyltransferase
VGLATTYGLEVLGLRRITLEVFDFNPRARRVYEKVGYVVTGVRAGAFVFDGVAVAAVDMAVDAESRRGVSRER